MKARLFFYIVTFITAFGGPLLSVWEDVTVGALSILCSWVFFTVTHFPRSFRDFRFTFAASICLSACMFTMILWMVRDTSWAQALAILPLFSAIVMTILVGFARTSSRRTTLWVLASIFGCFAPAIWLGVASYSLVGFCTAWVAVTAAIFTSVFVWRNQ